MVKLFLMSSFEFNIKIYKLLWIEPSSNHQNRNSRTARVKEIPRTILNAFFGGLDKFLVKIYRPGVHFPGLLISQMEKKCSRLEDRSFSRLH